MVHYCTLRKGVNVNTICGSHNHDKYSTKKGVILHHIFNSIYIYIYIYIYVLVISQYEYDILVITQVRGEAEDEC